MSDDPRVTDEATGLPPLGEVDPRDAILSVAFATNEGIAASPITQEPLAVKYLSVRGLVRGADGTPEWGQIHVAFPAEEVGKVIELLADA